MSRLRILSLLTLTLVASGLGLGRYFANAQVVVVHPGVLSGEVTLPVPAGIAPVSQLEIIAAPEFGHPEGDATRLAVPISAPLQAFPYSMLVDGGDPADANDPGKRYQVTMIATFGSSTNRLAQLKVRSLDIVTIDNPNGADTASFAPPALRTVDATVQLPPGHTLNYLFLQTATYVAGTFQYSSSLSRSFSGQPEPSSANERLAFPAVANAFVTGQATVHSDTGELLTYNLAGRVYDLSNGDAQISWTIAAGDSGVTGAVALSGTAPSQPLPDDITVWMRGPVTVATVVQSGGYSLALPAGTYQANLAFGFAQNEPYPTTASSYSAVSSLTLAPGTTTQHHFSESLSSLSTSFSIDGFYDLDDVEIEVFPRRVDPTVHNDQSSIFASHGFARLGVTAGHWELSNFVVMGNYTAPTHSTDSIIWRSYRDVDPPVTVDVAADLGQYAFPDQHVTLSRTTIYVDVTEGDGQPEVLLSDPVAYANKPEYGPDGRIYTTSIIGLGESAPANLAPLTLIAEPGQYTLSVYAATSTGQLVFHEPSLFVGEPVQSGPSPGAVVLNPVQDQSLQITLEFGAGTSQGVTSVVKSSFGPAPPSGFASLCTEQQTTGACAPTYYNLTTTVEPAGVTPMCVRQAYIDLPTDDLPDILATLALWHFRTAREGQPPACDSEAPPSSPQTCWEKLPAPIGKPRAANCATNLAACGCSTAEDCGIAQGVTVLQVCGTTESFSPFTVLRSAQTFAASATGATGTVQSWTAPATGTYRIRAVGARGGSGTLASITGGCGAQLSGDFALTAGTALQLLVGQRGLSTEGNGGGGGASFVVKNNAPLLVAGGGGGASKQAIVRGRDAKLTEAGASGSTSNNYTTGFIPGGTAGRGGARLPLYGAGGGGWSTSGAADAGTGEGGAAFLSSTPGRGGLGLACDGPPFADGGFGGGGAGNGCFGGGGGGGYSGGGGGRVAGGGGSFNAGANPQASVRCTSSGHGSISIERLN